MKMRRLLFPLLFIAGAAGIYVYVNRRPSSLTLTGVVTTNDVIISPQIAGQLQKLMVSEGDTVKKGQLVAVIVPDELAADTAYYTHSLEGAASQVSESQAALRFQERQTTDQIAQAESALASSDAQVRAAKADLENARLQYNRTRQLAENKIASPQEADQARTAFDAAQAKVDALVKQVDAQRAAVSLARANADQVAVRRSQVQMNEHMAAAAEAQRARADVRLRYTEVKSPIDGIIDVRAIRQGEYATAGQALLTVIDPEDLWVRVDVEETYIDRVKLGDTMTVRLPSGDERQGKVIFRGVDAGYATQRDVSRTKRDIRTFEVRLRVDNSDRRLAVGMTAYVLLPLQ